MKSRYTPKLLTNSGPRSGSSVPAALPQQLGASLPAVSVVEVDAQPVGMGQALQPLRRRWRSVAVLTLIGGLVATLAALRQPPLYRSVAQLEIEGLNQDFLNMKDLSSVTNDPAIDPYLQTQIKVLESPELLTRVATRLDLQRRDEFKSAGVTMLGLPEKPEGPEGQRVVRKLAQRVSARVSLGSHVIEVAAESQDPQFAATLATTMANEYLEYSLERRIQSTNNLSHSLSTQLQDLKTSLDRSEEVLQKYANNEGLVDLSETNPNGVAEASLRLAQEAASRSRDERIAEQSRYERALASPAESLPEVLDDATLRGYVEKLADLRRQDAELSATLKPSHYQVKGVRAQISAISGEIEQAKARILARMKNQFDSAQEREQLETAAYNLESELASNGAAKSIHYSTLKRDVETNRLLYESILQKAKEASVVSAVRATNAQLLSAGTVPTSPSKPVLPLYAGCGLVAGLCCGIVVAFARPSPPVRALSDLGLQFGIPQLAEIPHTSAAQMPLLWRESSSEGPQSQMELEEHIRAAVAAVSLSSPLGDAPRVLAVTSASAGEGKSTVAANLATALAQTGQRVLLIDAHLRRPRQHFLFGAQNSGGFSSLLENITPRTRQRAPQKYEATPVPGLWLMPAGEGGDAIASRLYSPGWAWMMASMRYEFDAIVIDAPPVSDINSRPLARCADGVLMVVAPRKTAPRQALFAIERLAGDGARIVGTILNHYDPRKEHAKETSAVLRPMDVRPVEGRRDQLEAEAS